MSQASSEYSFISLDDFDAMRRFLEIYWERGGKASDDIAVLLGSLNRDEGSQSLPLDAAMWEDWLDAVSGSAPSRS